MQQSRKGAMSSLQISLGSLEGIGKGAALNDCRGYMYFMESVTDLVFI